MAITDPIPATYVSATTFTVATDRTAEFAAGVRVRADCGADGIFTGTVTASSYATATDLTTVSLALDAGSLTANLTDVLHGNDNPASLANHGHTGPADGGVIGTATPTASKIPIADASGKLDPGWLPASLTGDNLIIDGNFDHWLEGTSQTTSGYGSHTMSRSEFNGCAVTHLRGEFIAGETDNWDAPATYYSRSVVTSVAGATNYARHVWGLGGVTEFVGKQTFSFRSRVPSGATNISVEFIQYFGANGSTTVTGIGSQLVVLSTDWAKRIVTVDIPSVAGKTIGAGNFLALIAWFDAGSSLAPRAANLGQQSGTFDIAQVKLDHSAFATPFVAPNSQDELRRILPYYYTTYSNGVTPGTASRVAALVDRCPTTEWNYSLRFPVPMRAIPSIKIYSPVTGSVGYLYQYDGTPGDKAAHAFNPGTTGVRIYSTLDVANYIAECHIVADARL